MKIVTEESVGSLFDELLESDDIRRYGRPTVHHAPTGIGRMGAGGGWVELLTTGLDITAVVVAVGAWLRPRQQHTGSDEGPENQPTVVIEHEGTTVIMSNVTDAAIDSAIRALRNQSGN